MERKLCAGCGEPNLQSETRCWACGGVQFTALGARPVGDRTILYASDADVTLGWMHARRLPPAAFYVAGALVLGLFTSSVGFWIGRASTPEVPEAQAAAATLPRSVALPAPSGASAPLAGSMSLDPGMALRMAPSPPPPEEPVRVSVRPKPVPLSPAQQRAAMLARMPVPPAPIAVGNAYGPVFHRRPVMAGMPVFVQRPAAPAVQNPMPDPAPYAPRPAEGSAIVTLRNETGMPVSVAVDGNGTRTAVVAPGASLPLPLPPGTYQMRASAGDASPASSTLAVGASQSYSLVVTHRGEGGRGSLTLAEPALQGGG